MSKKPEKSEVQIPVIVRLATVRETNGGTYHAGREFSARRNVADTQEKPQK